MPLNQRFAVELRRPSRGGCVRMRMYMRVGLSDALGLATTRRRAILTSLLPALLIGLTAGDASAQTKTPTGFYYPNGSTPHVQMCGGWLARDAAHGGCYTNGQYHIGADIEAPLGAPVYAVADGTVVFRSTSGWGTGNVGIAIRHYAGDGTAFIAVYGHIRTSVVAGNIVRAGVSFATIGPWSYGTHVHFGVAPGSTYPSGNLGTLSNTNWAWTNSFVDPLNWITTRSASTSSTPKLTVTIAGSGSGTVTSSPTGITCSTASCSKNYTLNTSVTLTATPASGQLFAGWSGACSGTGACVISMSGDKTVTASFELNLPPPGAFVKNGPIQGTRQSPSAVLTWTPSANAVSYEYCIDSVDNGACDASWVSTGAQLTAAPSGLAAGRSYSWQVRARAGTGATNADAGAWWRFTTAAAFKPFACDVNADGKRDLLWQHSAGSLAYWTMNGPTPTNGGPFGPAAPLAPWRVVGAGDFNADNRCDVLWFHPTTGNLVAWLMNGVTALEARQLSPAFVPNTQETVAAVVDMNGDGSSDIVWQNVVSGALTVWLMNGTTASAAVVLSPSVRPGPTWNIVGGADMNADGYADLVWQNNLTGALTTWLMRGPVRTQIGTMTPGALTDTRWKIRSLGDIDLDGLPDLLWQNDVDGSIATWTMRMLAARGGFILAPGWADPAWKMIR